MDEPATNEEVIRAYVTASVAENLDKLAELRHPEWSVEWPQSKERVRSHKAFAEIVQRYPGGAPSARVERIVGSEDRWVVTPSNTVVRLAGGGDSWWAEWSVTYPDGITYLSVALIELREGQVWRETVYWATPFEAPEWRAAWVERATAADEGSQR